jgi:hypothetical protein
MESLEETKNSNNIPSELHEVQESSSLNNNRTGESLEPTQSAPGAEGGMVLEHLNSKTDGKKAEGQTRGSPTNPMSVSVPNLPTSMEQTVSLLETFAAVARRNLGTVGMNNRSNALRLGSQNAPSKYKVLSVKMFKVSCLICMKVCNINLVYKYIKEFHQTCKDRY